MANEPEFYTATESFATDLEGGPVVIAKGENVRAGHALITANPDKFRPLEQAARFATIEQATAAPGEKRRTGRAKTTTTTED